jgi:two-component system sensor histidine kinase EvgS
MNNDMSTIYKFFFVGLWLLFYSPLYADSQEDKKQLKNNLEISFTGDPNWLPFEAFDKEGKYIGIVADYLKKIEKLLPLTFQPIETSTWIETLELAKKGEVDVISDVIDSEGMMKNYSPITPYFTTPIVIVMRDTQEFVNDLNDISDKKIALIKDYGYVGNIKKQYPNQKFVFVENADVILEQLSTGKIDTAILSMPKAGYLIRSKGYSNLKIVGKTSVEMHLTLFVLNSKPKLHALLEKTMRSISTSQHSQILKEWQKVEFAKEQDYVLLYQIVGLFFFFLLGTLYWNRKLSKEIVKRKEVENQIQILIDNIPIQIVVTSLDGRILMVNPKILHDYKLTKKDMSRYNVLDFYAERKARESVLLELQQKGKVEQKIIKFRHLDQRVYSMMTSIIPISYHNEKALLSISVDLSQRLEMEKELQESKVKAEQANQSKSEFLANMSHEIRTPMNSVIGFSELLAKQISDPIQKDYLDSIMRGGNALLGIINDILDLSKIEAGKLDIALESLDMKQLSMEMESIFQVKLIQKNLNFKLDMDASLPQYLLLDSTRIRQILFNLLGNTIKFTSSGHIKLSVLKSREDIEKSKIDLLIVVEDSGIGIKKEYLKEIFYTFEQQKGQDAGKYGGTGLGLAICKKLVQMMNGSISVESELGIGSKFTVLLKDVAISSVESANSQVKKSLENIQFEKATVMVVDDIKDNRKLVATSLREHNIEVVEAVDGKDALEKLRQVKVNLIFMDIKMPVMNGYEATKIIKNDELLKSIPVVALTASVLGKDREKIKEYKFDGYLRKPVTYDELLNEMGQFLGYKTIEKEIESVLSLNKLENIPQVTMLLEDALQKQWKEVKDMGDFSLIETFSESLRALGEEHGIGSLEKYAKELKLSCESFDIEKIDFMMNSYPSFVEKLKELNQ